MRGRGAQPRRPVLPHQIVVAADAAGRDDDGLRAQRKFAGRLARTAFAPGDGIGFEDRAPDSIDGAVRDGQRVDAVAEFERQQPRFFRHAGTPLKWFDDAGAGAPGHVEPRYRIAVAHGVVAAAFGPADHRENTVAHRPQPVSFLACGESQIRLRPAPRPEVFVAVEACRAHPVLMRQLVTVLDSKPALLRRIDQKQPAERPERLAAKILFALLIDHHDAPAGCRELGRGDKAGEPGADHDDVNFFCHRVSPVSWMREVNPALARMVNRYRQMAKIGRWPSRVSVEGLVPVRDSGSGQGLAGAARRQHPRGI